MNTNAKITIVETPERIWVSGHEVREGEKNYRLVYPPGGIGRPVVVIYQPEQPTKEK